MRNLAWNDEKNAFLKEQRGVCFDDVVSAINEGHVLDIIQHPQKSRYPNQLIYVVLINEYVYCVPCVEDDEKIFLKTIFPSRKFTKKYFHSLRKKV